MQILKTLVCGAVVATMALSAGTTVRAQGKDIVDTAVAAGQFKTLAAKGTVEDLLKPENKAKLTAILTYHVVAGKVMAADVVKLTSAKTVQGGSAKVSTMGGGVMIDASHVTKTDIVTSNGVIHVIDTVMMPK
jgi:hypothetical protein